MGKGNRIRARRADKQRRRAAQQLNAAAASTEWPGGWRPLDELNTLSDWDFPGPPDDAVLDTSGCPVDEQCAGCGGRDGLRAVTAAFTRAGGGYDVACATLCPGCDGRSFLHLFTVDQLQRAFAEHAAHQTPARPAPESAS